MRIISVCEFQDISGGATVNGCTGVPNKPFGYNFKPDCDNHDVNYSSGTNYTKSQADSIFLNDMLTICKKEYNNDLLCRASAYTYYAGVQTFGGSFYEGGNGFSSSNSGGGGSSFSSGFSF